jgi:glycosyltransferase involved in cell wall biosynthesis
LPEVVGDAALLFDPTRPYEIAAACLRVLSDGALQSDLRERSLRQAARFSWDDTARTTMNVYHDLMRSSGRKSGTKR